MGVLDMMLTEESHLEAYSPWPGASDLAAAAASLSARLPDELAVLARLAYSYRWTWLPGGDHLFASVDAHRWELCGHNPVRLLQEAPTESIVRAALDSRILDQAAALEEAVVGDLRRPFASAAGLTREHPAVFLCAEFGVHRSLPIYSGGLGILAGDLVKEASDQAVPMVALGLMYRQGYFRQRLDLSGWQHEYWVDTDPERLPAALVTDGAGHPLVVPVELRGRTVAVQVWRLDVGRVALYLLDAERAENERVDRWITSQLYVGDAWTRLAQYVLLGVGGIRVLGALGIDPGLVHLNEGHAALAPLELAHRYLAAGGSFDEALGRARGRTVFTTHTPVAAGNETYTRGEIHEALGSLPAELGLRHHEICEMGSTVPGDESVGVTQLALRLSRAANAVSRRHGTVANAMWRPVFARGDRPEPPISCVTNGVHLPTWMADPMRALLRRHLGAEWESSLDDPQAWAGVDGIPDEELWTVRNELRGRLVGFVRERSVTDRLMRGEPADYVAAAATAFDDGMLTVGFARRLATYKRLHLLTRDIARGLRLLGGDRPLQILIAGKAHPRDDEAKRLVQGLFAFKGAEHVGERVAYLHDYDLSIAPTLVAGCDVWLNLPRPPLEASGTSGMKSALNGGLQLSVLDGWWPEAYDGSNGWAIDGPTDGDTNAQDDRHAAALYDLLEHSIVPEFYDRDASGLPRQWLTRVKASLRTIGPRFCATRMVHDYLRGPYQAGDGEAGTG